MEQDDGERCGQGNPECAEAWRAFGSDTEAGRLLKKLYGGNAKPQIQYPKPKVKPRENNAPFIPGGGSVAADARTHHWSSKMSERAIKAPSFSKRALMRPELHPIDHARIRRKSYQLIEKEIQQIKSYVEAYRISDVKKQPNQEKEKLQQVFSFTAGSILPRELLPGADLLDKELSHSNARRRGKNSKDKMEQLEEIYDSVLAEIESRKQYMSQMLELGKPEKAMPIEKEILERMTELRKIHEMMQKTRLESNNNGSDA
ncbi:TPA: hypothetical protein N0F65_000990 [Lagenidium giganteum]|uniref:Uncharacterized protein n=1 Tax=Lagenidium giganteum TaxID=4803 RepID=A0AAV2Z292_9STRA|nr:TPA: hypothetical protein N0F65_000990 [Lagenidium giganteum]